MELSFRCSEANEFRRAHTTLLQDYVHNWPDECVGDFRRCYSVKRDEKIFSARFCHKHWTIPDGVTHIGVDCSADKKAKLAKLNEPEEEEVGTRACTFFIRKDGNSKLVMQIRDNGPPNVQASRSRWLCEVMIRWVITPIVDGKKSNNSGRPGRSRLLVKIGQFVVMKNHSALARKLRSKATRNAMRNQRIIFQEFKILLGANQDSINQTDSLLQKAKLLPDDNTLLLDGRKNVGNNEPCLSFLQCLPFNLCETPRFPSGTVIASDDELVTLATNLERKLKAVRAILEADRKFADSAEDLHFYLSQLFIVREALDNILQKYCAPDDEQLGEIRTYSDGFF